MAMGNSVKQDWVSLNKHFSICLILFQIPYILSYKTQPFLGPINPSGVEPAYKMHQNQYWFETKNSSSSLFTEHLLYLCVCIIMSSYILSPSSSELSYCSAHNISSSVPSKLLLIEPFLNYLVMMVR